MKKEKKLSQGIEIGEKNYSLKITLGFYKNLSFSKSELNTINDNAKRLFEVVKLAVFFGSKKSAGWSCIADMEKEISNEDFEDIDDSNVIDKISEAIFESYPDSLKEAIKNTIEEDSKKK